VSRKTSQFEILAGKHKIHVARPLKEKPKKSSMILHVILKITFFGWNSISDSI
jgi:hypothetical protein